MFFILSFSFVVDYKYRKKDENRLYFNGFCVFRLGRVYCPRSQSVSGVAGVDKLGRAGVGRFRCRCPAKEKPPPLKRWRQVHYLVLIAQGGCPRVSRSASLRCAPMRGGRGYILISIANETDGEAIFSAADVLNTHIIRLKIWANCRSGITGTT